MRRCPDEQTLRRYLDEELRDAEQNEIDDHVESCPDCEAVLERLTASGGDVFPLLKIKLQEPPDPGVVASVRAPIRNGRAYGDRSEDGPVLPPPPPGREASRYELFDKVGQGGIGVVFRARDVTLNRDVAVKVLLEKLCGDEAEEQRILAEAELTGRLQHPGIVPVHDVGRSPDGRPYFVMKLVRGRTLARLLAERPDPAQELPRFLAVFEQVCQAVAYAHREGVIHRDLKPGNVMVGALGEVQVMDWGMAKKLAHDGPAEPESQERSEAGWSVNLGAESDPDTVRGTVAYMAPEQARGELKGLDERCDVFGLGAILCEILTGRPPYVGESAAELYLHAARAQLAGAFARLDGCGADAVLVDLAKRCLAAEKESRPGDAGALARELRAYQEGVAARLRQTELARAAAEGRAREERKRRLIQLALAATVVLLFAAGLTGVWQYQQARREEEARQQQARREEEARQQLEKDRPVMQLLDKSKHLHEQRGRVRASGDEALRLAKETVKLAYTSGASESVRRQADGWLNKLQGELDESLDDRSLAALLRTHGPDYDRVYKGVLILLGLDVDNTTPEKAAEWRKARPSVVVTEVVAALDRWASERRRQGKPAAYWRPLAVLARLLDDAPDPSGRRRELRQILERGCLRAGAGEDYDRLLTLASQTDPATEPVLTLLLLTVALPEAGDDKAAARLLRAALEKREGEVLLHVALGNLLESQRPPELAEAINCYKAARALRPTLLGLEPAVFQVKWPFIIPSGAVATAWLRDLQGELLVALGRKLPYVLSGDLQLDNPLDKLDFAVFCGQYHQRYALSVHFYLEAFADSKLPWNTCHQHRYGAARAAVLAAAGQGEDARNLPDKVAVMFRRQALSWLRADLKYYADLLKREKNVTAPFNKDGKNATPFVRQRLEHWQKDPDLASVREEQALDKLPEADRTAWRQLWSDVDELRDKTKR
jgi:serine/threonine-protein kinase